MADAFPLAFADHDTARYDTPSDMTTPQATIPKAMAMRRIHAAMIVGVLLYAVVSHFVVRPTMTASDSLPPSVVNILLSVALGACAISALLRRRIPRRSRDDSSESYWTTAAGPAFLTWAPLEGACLLAVYLYSRTGAQTAIAVAAIAVVLFIALNPASLERV